jgi:hypothetical protein
MKLNATVSQNETSEIYLVTSYLPLVEQDLIPPPGAQEFTRVFSVVRVGSNQDPQIEGQTIQWRKIK